MELAQRERSRPLQYLRVTPSLLEILWRFPTIGLFLQAIEKGLLPIEKLTPSRAGSLRVALLALRQALSEEGLVDWGYFATLRPLKEDDRQLYLDHPCWDAVSAIERALPAGVLHLKGRTMSHLARGRLATLGQLLASVPKGLDRLPGAGLLAYRDIEAALIPLGFFVKAGNGRIDWPGYSQARGFAALPAAPLKKKTGAGFLEQLAAVIRRAVELKFRKPYQLVLRQRFLRPETERLTLKQIAALGGPGDTRLQQMETEIFGLLERIFLRDDYTGASFRFRKEIVAPVRQLATELGLLPGEAIAVETWKVFVGRHWGREAARSFLARRLLPALIGVELQERLVESTRKQIARARIYRFFRSRPGGITHAQFERILAQRGDIFKDWGVDAVVRVMDHIHLTEGRYQYTRRVGDLRADQCERLMRAAGRPMHCSEVIAAMEKKWPQILPRVLSNQIRMALRTDKKKRFARIGTTGLWTLKEWKFETRPLVPIVEELLGKYGPMTTRQLLRTIEALRPVTRSGLSNAMQSSPNIVRNPKRRVWEMAQPLV